jgi:hypothetical protein
VAPPCVFVFEKHLQLRLEFHGTHFWLVAFGKTGRLWQGTFVELQFWCMNFSHNILALNALNVLD